MARKITPAAAARLLAKLREAHGHAVALGSVADADAEPASAASDALEAQLFATYGFLERLLEIAAQGVTVCGDPEGDK